MSLEMVMQESLATEFDEEMREKYEPRIRELNAMATEIALSGIKDEYSYVIIGLSKLTSLLLDCEQYDLSIGSQPTLVDRVIKVNKYTQNSYLDYHGIDRVVVGGLFLVAPIYLLPSSRVHQASKNRFHVVQNPEEFGLPSNKECNYGTIKPLTSGCYMALAKFEGNYINEIVTTARNYDYVFLK